MSRSSAAAHPLCAGSSPRGAAAGALARPVLGEVAFDGVGRLAVRSWVMSSSMPVTSASTSVRPFAAVANVGSPQMPLGEKTPGRVRCRVSRLAFGAGVNSLTAFVISTVEGSMYSIIDVLDFVRVCSTLLLCESFCRWREPRVEIGEAEQDAIRGQRFCREPERS